jgi:hypothetical protein
MLLFFGILLIIIFGYLLSVVLVKEMRILERLGISFLLGLGVFTLLMFCYSTAGVRITLNSTLLALAMGTILLFVLLKLLKRKVSINPLGIVKSFSTFSRLEKIIVFMIAALGIGSLIITTYFPVYIWDSLALYDFRGKIIAQQGFYTQIVKNFMYFDGYPLFTSLSHTLVYIFGWTNPQFMYSFMYLAFILIFYGNLREFVNRKVSLIASLLLATIPIIFDHSTFAYTNLPYTIFLATGSIYLFTWFSKKKPIGYLILSAVLVGLSTWTRSAEPFWMVNIFVLAFLSMYRFKKYLFPTLIYIISFLLIKEPWSSVIYYQPVSTSIGNASPITAEAGWYATTLLRTTFNQARIGEVAVFIYQNVIVSWFPLLFLFLFCVFVNFRGFLKKNNTFILAMILLHFALLLYGTYRFSFNDSSWSLIPDSARRMAMFFIPLMIYYVGLSFGRVSINKNEKIIKKI